MKKLLQKVCTKVCINKNKNTLPITENVRVRINFGATEMIGMLLSISAIETNNYFLYP